jgi:hypothetical protein
MPAPDGRVAASPADRGTFGVFDPDAVGECGRSTQLTIDHPLRAR